MRSLAKDRQRRERQCGVKVRLGSLRAVRNLSQRVRFLEEMPEALCLAKINDLYLLKDVNINSCGKCKGGTT